MVGAQETEFNSSVENTRKERLSDEELGNLISAVGNNAAKMITLLIMRDGNIYSLEDLYRAFLYSQGTERGWNMDKRGPFKYCGQSLSPIGLVSGKVLESDMSLYGYHITDYGKRTGIPFCGLMLDWSKKNDVDLSQLWGQTHSRASSIKGTQTASGEEIEFRKRAPITTLKILYELLTNPKLPIRVTDIANSLIELPTIISSHLKRLAKVGLIEYQATETNKEFSSYRLLSELPIGELPVYDNFKTLTKVVFSVLQQNPSSYLTIKEIIELLPKKIHKYSNYDSIYPDISGILAFLKTNAYLEHEKFYSDVRSEINLNDDQRIILTELLEIIDRFQNQDPEIMAKGNKLADEIINNPSRVSDILKRAKEQSNFANKTPALETMNLIKYLITSYPGITNKEIQQLLEQEDKRLSTSRIRELTNLLEKDNSLRSSIVGNLKKFFSKDTPE